MSLNGQHVYCRILLTIDVTVVHAERRSSKLKLLMFYMCSTLSQERLNGLTVIAIDKDISKQVDYKILIYNFA